MLAERAAGRRAGTGDFGECGDDDAPGQAGEEQGGREAVGGDLVVPAVRDALDDLVGAEPAQVVADLTAGHVLRMFSLDQRITVRYHLSGMPAADTAAYLRHHLSLADRADPLFADDALAAIHDASRGKLREINNLARNALLVGYTERKNIIDHACIRAAITEASTDHKTP